MAGLSVWDYVVVAGMFTLSIGIGVFFAFQDRKKTNTQDLFLGGRQMGVFPVTMSLLASFLSAIMILGTSSEVYTEGAQYMAVAWCFVLVMPITVFLFMPVFYNLGITSVYDYLEIRFHSKVLRKACSSAFIVQMMLYMAVVLYAPALAINAVMGLNLWASVVIAGIVCTLYTSFGGLKAVMWTDVFQVCIMLAGLLAIIIHGCVESEGFYNIWATSKEMGRIDWKQFVTFDVHARYNVFVLVLGGTFTWLPIYAINQSQVQRAVACSTMTKAQIAFMINIPGLIVMITMSGLCGMVMLHKYRNCDPLDSHQVSTKDQILPLYVLEELSQYPGVPGLFMAAIFSGSLSTISSGINSAATVTMEDFIQPTWTSINDITLRRIAKVITLLYGVVLILLTYVASLLGGLAKAALSLFGMIGGPLLGVYILGIFVPIANSKGALVGLIVGLTLQMWIGLGAVIYPPERPTSLPRYTNGCLIQNSSLFNGSAFLHTSYIEMQTQHAPTHNDSGYQQGNVWLESVYSISYLWYGLIAVIITVPVGIITSCITGKMKSDKLDRRTISPIVLWCSGCAYSNINTESDNSEVNVPLQNKEI